LVLGTEDLVANQLLRLTAGARVLSERKAPLRGVGDALAILPYAVGVASRPGAR
jgi:hypothetical protein